MATEKLPRFEGQDVIGSELKINGVNGDQIGALKEGEKLYLVIEAEVYSIEHAKEKKGLKRLHKASMARVAKMDIATAQSILDAAEDEERRRQEEEQGIQRLPTGKDAAAGE